jgi:signal transduction histidine kinase
LKVKSRLTGLLILILLIITGVILISLFWEFYLEDVVIPYIYEFYKPEPMYERWEFVITAVIFATIALVIPAMVAFTNIKDADQAREALSCANEELEQRVQHRTRELVDTNEELKSAISERLQTEEALRKSEKELRLLSAQLLIARENERRRVSRNIHDNVSQTLVAMKFRIEQVLNESVGKTVNPSELSGLIVPVVQETIETVRDIYMHLWPSILDDLGLSATLTWLQRDFQNAHPDIDIRIDVAVKDSDIADDLKVVIYRVVEEALDNVARHSKADQVHVSLNRNNNHLELIVRDNGTGFRMEEVMSIDDSLRGMGLAGMRERTGLAGGTFAVSSGEGGGTTIHASLPLQQRQTA